MKIYVAKLILLAEREQQSRKKSIPNAKTTNVQTKEIVCFVNAFNDMPVAAAAAVTAAACSWLLKMGSLLLHILYFFIYFLYTP